MKATKKSSAWDVKKLPAKLVATFIEWEEREVKKDKRKLLIFDFKFEIDDIDGQEDFAELEISKGLWATRDEDGGVQMSPPNFQVTEALEGLEKDDVKEDGEDSPDFDELVGNRVELTIHESKKNPGYAEIDRVGPYDDDDEDEDEKPKRNKKKGKKATDKKRKKKRDPEPEPDDDDDDDDDDDEDETPPRKKKKKKRAPEPDDDDDDDDEEEPPRKKRHKKKPKPEPEDDDDDDDDDYDFGDDDDDDD